MTILNWSENIWDRICPTRSSQQCGSKAKLSRPSCNICLHLCMLCSSFWNGMLHHTWCTRQKECEIPKYINKVCICICICMHLKYTSLTIQSTLALFFFIYKSKRVVLEESNHAILHYTPPSQPWKLSHVNDTRHCDIHMYHDIQ